MIADALVRITAIENLSETDARASDSLPRASLQLELEQLRLLVARERRSLRAKSYLWLTFAALSLLVAVAVFVKALPLNLLLQDNPLWLLVTAFGSAALMPILNLWLNQRKLDLLHLVEDVIEKRLDHATEIDRLAPGAEGVTRG